MASLIDIRRRLRSVKNTQQITKAMKMVAASRLRRAQERITSGRPFANEMLRVLNSLATRVDPTSHPLLDERSTAVGYGKTCAEHYGLSWGSTKREGFNPTKRELDIDAA